MLVGIGGGAGGGRGARWREGGLGLGHAAGISTHDPLSRDQTHLTSIAQTPKPKVPSSPLLYTPTHLPNHHHLSRGRRNQTCTQRGEVLQSRHRLAQNHQQTMYLGSRLATRGSIFFTHIVPVCPSPLHQYDAPDIQPSQRCQDLCPLPPSSSASTHSTCENFC